MRDTLPFLQRLGLDEGTDARAIRRAYARELKLIDQERDSAGFQELREAYDTALQWAAWRDQQAAAQPEPAPAPPSDSEVPDYSMARTPVTLATTPATTTDAAPTPMPALEAGSEQTLTLEPPQASAAAVFAEFHHAMTQLAQQRHTHNTAEWQRLLQQSLNDDRLLNIDARIYFEAHIAHLLTGGWRPGHDVLFQAASKVFHWGEDRRRLRQLGQVGAHIDQAVTEQAMFERLPESDLMLHRAALALLRRGGEPTDYQLRGDLPYVDFLMQHFPAWMPMVVDVAVVEQWRARFNALPAPKKSWWPKLRFDISPRVGWVLAILLFNLLRMCWHDSEDKAPHTPGPSSYLPSAPSPAGVPGYQPLPEHIRQDIAARIPTLPLQLGPGQHRAELTITLDEQGKVYQLMLYGSSGSISYDEAVSKALRDYQPYPPETPRKFQVTFTPPTP
ncbi:protein TonB [Duganella sp. 1224]|uniref:TonB C-terminal domain-containing protein n=1 Tax=Duganella sp. 1224 TaxID=2587052 RepID=UPI0015CB5892|nr:TonB C-terminal domain-containing protein [Duganella sp. 1224]NYE64056.1 protein TonB [Duganella sp. 1224]